MLMLGAIKCVEKWSINKNNKIKIQSVWIFINKIFNLHLQKDKEKPEIAKN